MGEGLRTRLFLPLAGVCLAALPAGGQVSDCWWSRDFDGDGAVAWDDFFLFADHAGLTSEDPGWDPAFDLVADGRVGLDDVFALADWWPRGWTYAAGVCGDALIAPADALQLALDGDGDYAAISRDAGLYGNEAQTVEVRFRLDRFSSTNTFGWSQILSNDEYELAVRASDRKLVACCYNAPSTLTGATPIETGRWYNVAFVRDGGQQRLLLDGTVVDTGSVSVVEPALDLWFGNDPSPSSRAFAGAIDEVRIWRRALTHAEIAAHLEGGGVTPDEDLAGHWDFDAAVTTPLVRDRSENGHHGVLVGDAHLAPEGSGPPQPESVEPGAPFLTTSTAGDLVFEFLSSSGAGRAGFGLGTPSANSDMSEREVVFEVDMSGTSFDVRPSHTVNMGLLPAGSELHFYGLSSSGGQAYWAFSKRLGPLATPRTA